MTLIDDKYKDTIFDYPRSINKLIDLPYDFVDLITMSMGTTM
jgi:hypothetical protein